MYYTLRSLKAQTNQNFINLIRFEDSTEDKILRAISQYSVLPSNVRFIKTTQYDEEVKKIVKEHEYVYFARLDTDDLYHKSYVQQMYDYEPKANTVSLINRNGYIFDSKNNCLAKCFGKVVTFYTFICKTKDYLNGNIYNRDSTDIDNEQYIALRVPHEFIEKRNYIWHIHSTNTITDMNSWFITQTDSTRDGIKIISVLKEYMDLDK